MENPFSVSLLNDFVLCPASIYFHLVDAATDKILYESKEQQEGSALHEKTDTGQYSDRKNILQGISVFFEQYNLSGKIDIFDEASGVLTERKRKIATSVLIFLNLFLEGFKMRKNERYIQTKRIIHCCSL